MRRNDFSRESELIGKDFSEVLERFGGKAAGVMLLDSIVSDREFSLSKNSVNLPIPPYAVLSTSISKELSWILESSKKGLQESIEEDIYPNNISKVADKLGKPSRDCSNIENFLGKIRRLDEPFPSSSGPSYWHLRSSSTVEDWKDDKYFGTFLSKTSGLNYRSGRANRKGMKDDIDHIFCDFF
ncbi:MAG: hypothetical protein ABEI74_01745 [Candidatus Pacearchaeota archaeon]